ncbi:DUF5342 family protein [Metabacillus fastidiosus]|uniref:DUF5342 family protein n=1 Tax=Metabacillus fastidiosus TaxID=1458 RepID=UPI003D2D1908
MFQNFEIKPMFEGQFHERHQFTISIEGNEYKGIFHEGDIDWFNPHPANQFEEDDLDAIEAKVHDALKIYIE